MLSYRVELNEAARQQVLVFGEQAAAQDQHPSDRLAGSHLTLDYVAMPGISVPDVTGLENPFVVPLDGDNHTLRASIE
jgi:hypothetical protein